TMAALERWLCDPSDDELLHTLQEVLDGADYAGAVWPHLRTDAHDWRAFVARAAEQPEGKECWQPQQRGPRPAFARDITLRPEVHVIWWTDGARRRHWRIAGWSEQSELHKITPPLPDASLKNRQPPLWFLFPDRLYWLDTPSHRGWHAVCGCGAMGVPEAIG